MRKLLLAVGFGVASAVSLPASAIVGFADQVVNYFDSGVGPIAGPYGGLNGAGGAFPVPVATSVVLGNDVAGVETFLSLPTGSSVTVRFTDEIVLNGPGNDIFIQEIGANNEDANVFVSSDGFTFFLLGVAQDDGITAFDLSAIGFTSPVSFVRVVGLDSLGGSPGFDVVNVQGLPGSIQPVAEPATLALLGLGLFGIAALRRRRR